MTSAAVADEVSAETAVLSTRSINRSLQAGCSAPPAHSVPVDRHRPSARQDRQQIAIGRQPLRGRPLHQLLRLGARHVLGQREARGFGQRQPRRRPELRAAAAVSTTMVRTSSVRMGQRRRRARDHVRQDAPFELPRRAVALMGVQRRLCMPPSSVALRRARVTSASARIGFDFCGMVDEPPPSASRTSPTSFCASSSTSWPELAQRARDQRQPGGELGRSRRAGCARASAGQPRPSSAASACHHRDPMLADRGQVAGGTAELDHAAAAASARPAASRWRSSGASQPATLSPNVVGTACWKRVRPMIGVARCSSASRASAAITCVQPPLEQRQRLAQLQDQGGVEDVLRGGAPMDEARRLAADLPPQLGHQGRHRHAGRGGAAGEIGEVRREPGEGGLDRLAAAAGRSPRACLRPWPRRSRP